MTPAYIVCHRCAYAVASGNITGVPGRAVPAVRELMGITGWSAPLKFLNLLVPECVACGGLCHEPVYMLWPKELGPERNEEQ